MISHVLPRLWNISPVSFILRSIIFCERAGWSQIVLCILTIRRFPQRTYRLILYALELSRLQGPMKQPWRSFAVVLI